MFSDSRESLQKLIDVAHGYCNKWILKANVSKSAVMVFSKNSVEGGWKWGEHKLPKVSNYSYPRRACAARAGLLRCPSPYRIFLNVSTRFFFTVTSRISRDTTLDFARQSPVKLILA